MAAESAGLSAKSDQSFKSGVSAAGLTAASFGLLLGACGSPQSASPGDLPLRGTDWQVMPAQAPEMSAPEPATLRLNAEDNNFSAFTGCNRMFGSLRLEGPLLELTQGGMTRMACPPPADAEERRFVAALPLVASWQIQGSELRLLNANGQPVLSLRAGVAR